MSARAAATEQRFELTAYCFMPDRVHLIAGGRTDDADFRKFAKAAKQCSGYYDKKKAGSKLWERDGYEHVVRRIPSSDDVASAVRRKAVEEEKQLLTRCHSSA